MDCSINDTTKSKLPVDQKVQEMWISVKLENNGVHATEYMGPILQGHSFSFVIIIHARRRLTSL